MTVKPKRHLVKAITWRLIASLTTFIIGWIVTGDLDFGMTIGAADVIIKIALYYFHERLWYHSKFGVINDKKQSECDADLTKKSKQKSIGHTNDCNYKTIQKNKFKNNLILANEPETTINNNITF